MNNVSLVGRTTAEVELRKTKDDTSYARFTLAVQRPYKRDEADFIQCVAWRKTADTAKSYVHKGDRIGVNGFIQTGKYKDKDGKTIYTTDVIVEALEFLEPRTKETASEAENEPEPPTPVDPGFDIDSDDLPF